MEFIYNSREKGSRIEGVKGGHKKLDLGEATKISAGQDQLVLYVCTHVYVRGGPETTGPRGWD